MNSILSNTLNKMLAVYSSEVGIYIFGTGKGGQVVYKYLDSFNFNIKGFFDNDRSKNGTHLDKLIITEPMKIGQEDIVVITSLDYDAEMYRQAIDIGINIKQIVRANDWLTKLLREDKSSQYVYNVGYIDIIDACNLCCATCPRSTIKGTGKKMDLGSFCKILDKLVLYTPMIGLYNWSEPFLHPELLKFVKEIKRRSMVCSLSSNLALPNIPQISDVLDALRPDDGDQLFVSVSGMQQSTYEVNHIGGKLETVKRNIEMASSSKNKRAIVVRFLRFDYNQKEEDELIQFCNKLGISYHIGQGIGNPRENIKLTNVEEFVPVCCPDSKSLAPCGWIFDHIAIDVNGDVCLCCGVPPHKSYNIGSLLEQDIADITLKRYCHPHCTLCTIPPHFHLRDFSNKDLSLIMKGLQRVCS